MAAVLSLVSIDDTFSYRDLNKSHVLVPTTIMVTVKNADPGRCMLVMPDDVLPFGLVEAVAVHGRGVPDFRIHVMKDTGMRVTPRVSVNEQRRVSVAAGPMNTDQDAADARFDDIRAKTGHDLRFRLLHGEAIVSMAIEFYGAPPPLFTIVYYGANALPAGTDIPEAKARLASRVKVDFLMLPKTPTARRRSVKEKTAARNS